MTEPPPFTSEEIQRMTSHAERVRARAELCSYILRMKQSVDNQAQPANTSSARRAPARPVYNDNHSSYGSYNHSAPGPQRGSSDRGRGGAYAYHPYQRPTPKFRNKTVIFNNADSSSDTLEDGQTTVPVTSNTRPGQGNMQQTETEAQPLCRTFTLTGICSRHGCRCVHDPEKQAICKGWLFKGECPKGDACPLSHNHTAHNAPTCQHFQEGRCNNDNCRFSHVRINPAALNCEAFGLLGYCEKGADCAELHAHECPHFSNTGSCFYGEKCRLGHVRRAARMRKATRHSSEVQTPPSDTSKEDRDATTDAEILIGRDEKQTAQNAHLFTQQVDFVSLGADD